MDQTLTCDPEAVRSAGVRQDVRRRLIVLEQTLPLGEVVVSEKIQRLCSGNKQRPNVKVKSLYSASGLAMFHGFVVSCDVLKENKGH